METQAAVEEDVAPSSEPAVTRSAPAGPLWRREPLTVVLCAAVIVLFACGTWTRRWMSDDGFINVHVVHQIFAGHGPVFNTGERVEAATSPLWIALLVIGKVLLFWLPIEWVAVLLGIAMTVVALVLALVASSRAFHTQRLLPLGVIIYAVLPPARSYATSGLENGLTALWIASWYLLLVRAVGTYSRRRTLLAAFVIGLGPLVRPDLLVMSVIAAAVLLFLVRPWSFRRIAAIAGAGPALPVAYEIFRMGYYGNLLPNTAFAKDADRRAVGTRLDVFRRLRVSVLDVDTGADCRRNDRCVVRVRPPVHWASFEERHARRNARSPVPENAGRDGIARRRGRGPRPVRHAWRRRLHARPHVVAGNVCDLASDRRGASNNRDGCRSSLRGRVGNHSLPRRGPFVPRHRPEQHRQRAGPVRVRRPPEKSGHRRRLCEFKSRPAGQCGPRRQHSNAQHGRRDRSRIGCRNPALSRPSFVPPGQVRPRDRCDWSRERGRRFERLHRRPTQPREPARRALQ